MSTQESLRSSFSSFCSISPELKRAAAIAARHSLNVREGEKALIITNPQKEVSSIAFAMYDAIQEAGGKPVIIYQPIKSQVDFAEEATIAAFDSKPDIVVSLSAEKMGKDRDGLENPYGWDSATYDHIFHYQLYGSKTVRAFWSPRVTEAMFVKTVPIDYPELTARCAAVSSILAKARSIKLVNPKGTMLTIGVEGRAPKSDDGDFSRPGAGGNLPAGEVFISPVLGSTNGIIVFDGSISAAAGDILIKTPIRVKVENGFVTDISGGEEAEALLRSIELGENSPKQMAAEGRFPKERAEQFSRNARNIGELGIGLNPKAEISGNMLEDEKAFHTCHIAIGSNYDGDAPALIHLDGLVSRPTITAVFPDGSEREIERDGELLA